MPAPTIISPPLATTTRHNSHRSLIKPPPTPIPNRHSRPHRTTQPHPLTTHKHHAAQPTSDNHTPAPAVHQAPPSHKQRTTIYPNPFTTQAQFTTSTKATPPTITHHSPTHRTTTIHKHVSTQQRPPTTNHNIQHTTHHNTTQRQPTNQSATTT